MPLNNLYIKYNKPIGLVKPSYPQMPKQEGRPTKYSKKTVDQALEYMDQCQDEDVQVVRQANEEKGYEMYENKLKVKLPSIEGLAAHLKVHRDTLYKWAEEYKEFSDILEQLRVVQAERLINNGLSGNYNPTITKLILSKHGYVEKNTTEHSGQVEQRIIYLPQRNERMATPPR